MLKVETGSYLGVSYGTPEHRLLHYRRPHLKFTVSTFKLAADTAKEAPGVHFAYVCKKQEGADEQAEERWREVEEAIKLEEQGEEDVMDDSDEDDENEEDKELKEGEEIIKKAAEEEEKLKE